MAEPDAKPPATSGGSSKKKWIRKNKRHGYKPSPAQPTKFYDGMRS